MTQKQIIKDRIKDLPTLKRIKHHVAVVLTDRCVDPECDGHMVPWSVKKSYCNTCGITDVEIYP